MKQATAFSIVPIQNNGFIDKSVWLAKDNRCTDCLLNGVPRNTCIIKTAIALTMSMSYFNAIEYRPDGKSPFSSHGVTLPRPFIDVVGPEETTIFFLIGQNLQGPEGFWYPYIQTLPQADDITTLLYYEEEDLAWLNGTNLYQAREQRIQQWRSSYENGMKILRESGMAKIDNHSWLVLVV
jgi:hypothetical protein